MLNQIMAATIAATQKNQIGGCLISFMTMDIMGLDTIVSIKTPDEKTHYFNVISISATEDEEMVVIGNETGMHNRKIEYIKDFDLRTLVNLPITIVTDAEEINKVRQEAHWC